MACHFFTSDLHLDHKNIVAYSERTPWMTEDDEKTRVQKMSADLIKNINSLVGPKDHLWVLGDWSFSKNEKSACEWIQKVNTPHVHIIFGNHDRTKVGESCETAEGLLNISIDPATGDYTKGKSGGRSAKRPEGWININLCHYCMIVWNLSHHGSWHLYGHSHGNLEEKMDQLFPNRRSMDVGVDNAAKILGEYRPFSLNEIREIFVLRGGYDPVDHHGR